MVARTYTRTYSICENRYSS